MYLLALFSALISVQVALAALKLGCYILEVSHQQETGIPQAWTDCAEVCRGYFPQRKYAYHWRTAYQSEPIVDHCWCTNHMPEGRFVSDHEDFGKCTLLRVESPGRTDTAVYLTQVVGGWTDVGQAIIFPNSTDPVIFFQDVATCLVHCDPYTYATWQNDSWAPDELRYKVSCRCFNEKNWYDYDPWPDNEYRPSSFVYRHDI